MTDIKDKKTRGGTMGACLEFEAFKMAREQAKSRFYTPPELLEIEERIRSEKDKEHSTNQNHNTVKTNARKKTSTPRATLKKLNKK